MANTGFCVGSTKQELVEHLKQPLNKLKKDVLTILRLGIYQILFCEKIPESAAVNESVKLTKNNNCAYACGLVNAVLRQVRAEDLTSASNWNFC